MCEILYIKILNLEYWFTCYSNLHIKQIVVDSCACLWLQN